MVWLQARTDFFGRRNGAWVDLRRALFQVIGVGQLRHGYLGEVRVAEVVGTVSEHAFFDFCQQVNVARGVQLNAFKVSGALLFNPNQLGQRDTAGAW